MNADERGWTQIDAARPEVIYRTTGSLPRLKA
jgi:hypothetical protein